MIKVCTFNVNSVNARLNNLLSFLQNAKPDIVCLQELKCEVHKFPQNEIEELGYNCLIIGQKSYNGVAILSKYSIQMELGQIEEMESPQARYVEAIVSLPQNNSLRVICVYCPNGNPLHSEKYEYKLAWMDKLRARAQELLALEEKFIIGGDWNIIARPEDCYDPKAWENDALYYCSSREKWHELVNLGLTDAFISLDGREHQYTFWDYQAGAWPRNQGIRIDNFLLSPQAADFLKSFKIHRQERELPKASDHVPVSIEFSF